MPLKAYEGSEKYIFVSYAHKDSDDVMKVIEWLSERGYRIWYDEGIAPGSEWPENIAQHLDACEAVIAFVTPNSMASPNCRREITFALSRQKPFLSVVLCQTEMPLGMELQLAAQQSVLRYNFNSEKAFLDKICACPDLAPCRVEPPAEQPQAEQSQAGQSQGGQSQTEQPQAKQPQAGQPQAKQPETAPSASLEAAKPVLPEPAKGAGKPAKKPLSAKPGSGKKKLVLAAAAACVVLVAVLAVVISALNTVTVVDGYKLKKSDTYALIEDAEISSAVIENINKLEELNSLNFANCTFDSGALDQLRVKPSVFSLTDCSGVDSLDILASIENLGSITIQSSNLQSLPDLSGTKLYQARIIDNPDFTDISVLPSTMTHLEISGTGVSDLSPLAECSKLVTVIADNSPVSDISCLSNLKELMAISMSNCRLTSADTESFALRLKILNLAGNGLKDCSGFSNTTLLEEVDLSGNALTDVSWLGRSATTLTDLDLSQNALDAEHLAFIKDCAELEKLSLNDIPMADLSCVEGLSKLTALEAVHCGIRDIQTLEKLPQLEIIRLSLNEITDISPLHSVSFSGYNAQLDLAYNKISSVSPLNGLFIGRIALQGNPVAFTGTTLDGTKGALLAIDYSDGLEKSGLTGENITDIMITGCPADRQLAIGDILWPYGKFVSEEEQLESLRKYFDYSPWEAYLP